MAEAQAARTVESLPPDWKVVRLAHQLRERLPEFRERYSVQTLELFGSYVRNQQRLESDLDVLVSFQRTPTLFQLVALKDELTDFLGVPVDIVLRSTLRPGIERNIRRDAVEV